MSLIDKDTLLEDVFMNANKMTIVMPAIMGHSVKIKDVPVRMMTMLMMIMITVLTT